MKKIEFIITAFTCLLFSSNSAQTVIDMASSQDYENEFENGAYYHKDINNFMNKFIGTWKYEYDTNKEFRITIDKVEMHHILDSDFNFNYYTDDLSISYQLYVNDVLTYQSPLTQYAGSAIKSETEVILTFRDFGRLGAPFDLELRHIRPLDSLIPEKVFFDLDNWEKENPYHDSYPTEPYYSVPNEMEMTKMD